MNAHPFSRFIELITFDQSIHELDLTLGKVQQDIATIKQKIGEQDQLELQAQTAAVQARKTVDRIELDLQALDVQAREKKKKVDQVATYKESQAFERELAQIHANQQAFEDTLLKAWNSLEHAERAAQECAKHAVQVKQELGQELEKKEQAGQQARDSLENLNKIRESKTVGVPQEWLEKYNAMRTFTSNPVVAVEGDNCGACYHELSRQEITRLKRGALLECQGCFRFLYNQDVLSEALNSTNNTSNNTSNTGNNSREINGDINSKINSKISE
jgi:predicted  nucleic acid-binding Zn-ribbon protein